MQGHSIRIYVKRLIADGHRWQYTDISDYINKPRFYFTPVQWTLIFVSIIFTPFLFKGFNQQFVSYVLAALSIFVGLFLTLILTAFEKFKTLQVTGFTHEEQRYYKTRKNFFKQFTSLTAYAIIISLLCIVLLGIISLVDPLLNDSILNHPYATPNKETISKFLIVFFKTVYNTIIMYFLLDFLVLVLYAVTSIHSYMSTEFDNS